MDVPFFEYPIKIDGQSFPLEVKYCGVCSMPIEYCEYGPCYATCKEWLEKNLPEDFEALNLGKTVDSEESGKKSQSRGGKALLKLKKKSDGGKIYLTRAPRGKKKFVTVITGLSPFGIDLKDASKYLGSRLACGCSVTGDDELVVQGDVRDDLCDILPDKWEAISDDSIEIRADQKR